ncbi:hypothetical protein NPIL_102161 [Nephila pilipes]|uniref:Uncharacterized protein n=1 Tax=Nephila pilipes TaxID=299642 RepID=A0A8X6Q197_NEPPI|nr:hypothetical protein NPIL_102161 [Nephila pilipes]
MLSYPLSSFNALQPTTIAEHQSKPQPVINDQMLWSSNDWVLMFQYLVFLIISPFKPSSSFFLSDALDFCKGRHFNRVYVLISENLSKPSDLKRFQN